MVVFLWKKLLQDKINFPGPLETSWGWKRPSSSCCTWLSATPSINTGCGEKRFRIVLPRRTWQYWWMKGTKWPATCTHRPETQLCSRLCKWPAGDFAPLLCSHEIPPTVLHSALGCLEQEGCQTVGVWPEEGQKDGWKDGVPIKKGKRARLDQPG